MDEVTVIGAGLAGCEAANIIARFGLRVRLFEMKPHKFSPAHKSKNFAELVCSNSFKSERKDNASGILKNEMAILGSLVIKCAKESRVPAGGSLAVDRDEFSGLVTESIEQNPNIEIIREECSEIPDEGKVVIATGPLTSDALSCKLAALSGDALYFYDAAAPIISAESIDFDNAFSMGRYDQQSDYINCPLTKELYDVFYDELINAEKAETHEFENVSHFEGCMPIEEIARRGYRTPLFGPMSPKGLIDPVTGRRPFAVVQLRKENSEGTMYNIVGFQTNLKFPEQKRVFGLIPALRNAEFLRYGVMHRNTYINSPVLLDTFLRLKKDPRIRFAGQITGVEGYMESAACGMITGLFTALEILGKQLPDFPPTTAFGALLRYVTSYSGADFQPMNINYGIMEDMTGIKQKKLRRELIAKRAEEEFKMTLDKYGIDLEEGYAF